MRAMALRTGVAGILFVLTSGAHAALVEREDAEVRTMEADRSGKILPPKIQAPLRAPAGKHGMLIPPAAVDKTDGTAPASGGTAAKGRKMTVLTDEAGVEYFCSHSRRRLWIQDQGWVIRRVPSCF